MNVILSLSLFVIFLVISNGARSISLSTVSLKECTVVDTGTYTILVNSFASIAAGFAPKFLSTILDNPSLSISQSWRLSFTICLIALSALTVFLMIVGYMLKKQSKI